MNELSDHYKSDKDYMYDDDDGVYVQLSNDHAFHMDSFFFSIGKWETLFLIRLGSLFAFLNVLGHNLGSINPSTQKNACASLISISRFTHTVNRFFFLLSPSGRCSVQEQSKSGLLEKKCANVK